MSKAALEPELSTTKIVDLRCPECGTYTLDTYCKICGVSTVSEIELTREDHDLFTMAPKVDDKRHLKIVERRVVIEETNVNFDELLDEGEV